MNDGLSKCAVPNPPSDYEQEIDSLAAGIRSVVDKMTLIDKRLGRFMRPASPSENCGQLPSKPPTSEGVASLRELNNQIASVIIHADAILNRLTI